MAFLECYLSFSNSPETIATVMACFYEITFSFLNMTCIFFYNCFRACIKVCLFDCFKYLAGFLRTCPKNTLSFIDYLTCRAIVSKFLWTNTHSFRDIRKNLLTLFEMHRSKYAAARGIQDVNFLILTKNLNLFLSKRYKIISYH